MLEGAGVSIPEIGDWLLFGETGGFEVRGLILDKAKSQNSRRNSRGKLDRGRMLRWEMRVFNRWE